MNRNRRARIADLSERMKLVEQALAEVQTAIDSITRDEQASFDAMPEGLMESPNGRASYAAILDLDNARAHAESASYRVRDVIEALDYARTTDEHV